MSEILPVSNSPDKSIALGFIGAFGTLVAITVAVLIKSNRFAKIFELLKNPLWLANLFIITIWCLYILLQPNDEKYDKSKDSARKAIVAFIIGIFAFVDLTITPFWLVFTFAYFSEGWV